MADQTLITPGSWARVHYDADCPGYPGHPHHPAEEGTRVEISHVGDDLGGGHCVRGNYKGAPWSRWDVPMPNGGLGVGRSFRPDELEVLPPGQIDPTPADDAARRASLQARMLADHPEPGRASDGAVRKRASTHH